MPSISMYGSPSIVMRSENVPESPSSALQTTYFCAAAVVQHRLPLDAGRERCATAAAQARLRHLLDDGRAVERQRALQAGPTFVRFVIGERQRIGHAHARERQALLPREIRDRFGRALAQRVCAAVEQPGIEQRG